MGRSLRFLSLLGVSAVPGVGFLLAGWSASTALVLYWWENLFGSLLIAARLSVYRRLTRGRDDAPDGAAIRAARSNFLSTMLVFTIAHGYFLSVLLLFIMPRDQGVSLLRPAELTRGFLSMTGFLVAGFCTDLFGLRERPFDWIKSFADGATGRMIVVHLTVIFGGAAYAFFGQPRAMFAVFVGLKLLLDIAWLWPRQEKTAPGWIDLRERERSRSPEAENPR